MDVEALRGTNITVSEVYDKLTVQGEGPSCGRVCTFVRLGLCNLYCRWCDTPYTWDWLGKNGVVYDKEAELTRTTVGEVLDSIVEAPRLVITGGEPLIQKRAVLALATLAVRMRRMFVEVETNGTIMPLPEWHAIRTKVQWNVSPKLAHSGMDYDVRIDEEVLAHFARDRSSRFGAAFKYVCTAPDDVDEVEGIMKRLDAVCGQPVDRNRVWIMPEGITAEAVHEHARRVADRALHYGFNITPRLHVELWGTERGR